MFFSLLYLFNFLLLYLPFFCISFVSLHKQRAKLVILNKSTKKLAVFCLLFLLFYEKVLILYSI